MLLHLDHRKLHRKNPTLASTLTWQSEFNRIFEGLMSRWSIWQAADHMVGNLYN